jgi:hypothetical protein
MLESPGFSGFAAFIGDETFGAVFPYRKSFLFVHAII